MSWQERTHQDAFSNRAGLLGPSGASNVEPHHQKWRMKKRRQEEQQQEEQRSAEPPKKQGVTSTRIGRAPPLQDQWQQTTGRASWLAGSHPHLLVLPYLLLFGVVSPLRLEGEPPEDAALEECRCGLACGVDHGWRSCDFIHTPSALWVWS